jgi:hypothetical protein
LSQVQFCINGKSICNNAGEYFVADFVAVVEKTNARGQAYLDAIIIDSKLSKGTDFTVNQKVADGIIGEMTIKSNGDPIKGQRPTNFTKDGTITKQGSMKKMYSDGNGNFQDVY